MISKDKQWDTSTRGAISALWFNLTATARLQPSLLVLVILYSLLRAGLPLVGVLLPKYVLNGLAEGRTLPQLLPLALIAAVLSAALYFLSEGVYLLMRKGDPLLDLRFEKLLTKKSCELNFRSLEDPETLAALQSARVGQSTMGNVSYILSYHLPGMLTQLFTLLSMSYVLLQLDWTVLLAMAVCTFLSVLLVRRHSRAQTEFRLQMGDINRVYLYLCSLYQDYSNGKDIRLFHASPMIGGRIDRFNRECGALEAACDRVLMWCSMGEGALGYLQTGVVYAAMLGQLFRSGLGIGDFVAGAAAAAAFSAAFTALFSRATEALACSRMLAPFKDFLSLPVGVSGEAEDVPRTEPMELRFEDVSFTYPRAESPTLRHLNLTLKPGEKLAVVGENGAGKTTMVKLLLRLYEPDEGRILLGGRDIRTLSPEAYASLFSVVFQDFRLFAFSVAENVALDRLERERLEKALEQAGLTETLAKLPQGADSLVSKQFDEKGVEFSGGERQKIAIARALYKGAPIVVMDEPTAALDPLAEAEIYDHLGALVGGRTALFISHRLSSCRFCDEVAVFEKGTVTQLGSHEALMAQDGPYRRMFSAQAKYYN